MTRRAPEPALLVLADGATFEGEAIGAPPEAGVTSSARSGVPTGAATGAATSAASGEVVFNTALCGYQEILTDPSYAGQIITFTYPHIGNYGVNAHDDEHRRPHCRGVIVRDLSRRPSNWRAQHSLADFLARHGLPGIAGIDTRRLTRHLREHGALPGAFGPDEAAVRAAAAQAGATDGVDLVATVTTPSPYHAPAPREARFRVVAYDFGIKATILDHLRAGGCAVEVVPAATPASEVLARRPDGVFLSNGPGDPAAVVGATTAVRDLVGAVPVFGICLGHQILGRALGARTTKLAFGHHGANHPVRHEATGRVEITSQNHNYAVELDGLDGPGPLDRGALRCTHVNLNDGVLEGMALPEARAFSVQYHPEAGPGPHDARYLFDDFATLMASGLAS